MAARSCRGGLRSGRSSRGESCVLFAASRPCSRVRRTGNKLSVSSNASTVPACRTTTSTDRTLSFRRTGRSASSTSSMPRFTPAAASAASSSGSGRCVEIPSRVSRRGKRSLAFAVGFLPLLLRDKARSDAFLAGLLPLQRAILRRFHLGPVLAREDGDVAVEDEEREGRGESMKGGSADSVAR